MRHRLTRLTLAVALALAATPAIQVHAQQQTAAPVQDEAPLPGLYRQWQDTQDPDKKIALGEQLLVLERKSEAWPLATAREQVKAEIWFGLGSAYVTRLDGVRADNLEQGIALLEAALEVSTRSTDGQNWAQAHNNLAIAYWARIRGERSDNEERAIAHFEAAASVLTRDATPDLWARLQNNLGIVYTTRIHGDAAANIEQAIVYFEAALMVLSREQYPEEWAKLQNNLASTYQNRKQGERAGNREKEIAHFEAALTVFTREASPVAWATAQSNLAAAYLNRVRGEAAANQDKAIGLLEAALTALSREQAPQQWATVHRLAGNAFADRSGGVAKDNRSAAVAHYEAALTVFTRDAFPQDHMRTSRSLGRVWLDAGDPAKAGKAYADAREAFLLLFGQGLEDEEARAVIADAGPLFPEAAFAALLRGEPDAALEFVSEGKARRLSVVLKLQTLDLNADELKRLSDLRIAIRKMQQAVEASTGAARAAYLEKLATLRQGLLGLVKAGGTGGADTALAQARNLTASGGAVIVPVVTGLGGKLLVIAKPKDGKEIAVIDLPALTTQKLADLLAGSTVEPKSAGWLAGYFVQYLQGPEAEKRWPEWLAAIDGLGPELWRLFGRELEATLKERGVQPGQRLLWLPSGWLGVWPLGLSQNPDTKRRLAEDYEIVYAPSLAIFASSLRDAARPAPATLAAIVNPTGDLAGAESEGAMVAARFASGARTILKRQAATPDAVIAALKGRSYWHFATHGTFAWFDPRRSALLMSGGARLSVGKLQEIGGLGHPRLVVMSACETGLTELTSNPDEFIGLPGAFAALGATGVIGTLWPVSDAATALLMAKVYELHLDARLAPPTALARAQAWLREATNDELAAYAKQASSRSRLTAEQYAGIAEALSVDALARSRNGAIVKWVMRDKAVTGATKHIDAVRTARPYAHPYFWAGFVYTGL